MPAVLEVPELLLAVFSYLDGHSLSMCSQVCKRWHQPGSDMMWSRVQTLEYVVSKFIPERLLERFREPVFRYLSYKGHPDLFEPAPQEAVTQGEDGEPTDDDIEQAMIKFAALRINWARETAAMRKCTQQISHIRFSHKSHFPLRLFYVLQRCHPTVVDNLFPRLTSIAFVGNYYAPLITHCLMSVPSIRHITFEANMCRMYLRSWILACQPALGLESFSIKLEADDTDRFAPHASYQSTTEALCSFISSRALWKRIDLPGKLVKPAVLTALAAVDSLESLTLTGPVSTYRSALSGNVFKSLRTLRMRHFSNGEACFKGVTLPSLENLVLEFGKTAGINHPDCPKSYLATMAKACPNVRNIEAYIMYSTTEPTEHPSGWISDSWSEPTEHTEHTPILFTDSVFEPLLPLNCLERLVVRVLSGGSICLSDDFLSRAARSWPHLRELDMNLENSSQTLVTLQGLVALARCCLNLRSLQIGLRPKHVNTVFNPELYEQEHRSESDPICGLVYLNVGCPSVYGSTAVSTFLSTIFPRLRRIECPSPSSCESFNEGDHFVWSQVVRMVGSQGESDVDDIARTLRAQDLSKKNAFERDPGHDDIDDSDEDYWAYSGSEDESYSSDDD